MNIELLDSSRLNITLKSLDLHNLGLTFEKLDWRNDQSRIAIKGLLGRASSETGFNSIGQRLLIEAAPYSDGGCILKFTILSKKDSQNFKKYRIKHRTIPVAYEFKNINDILSLLEKSYNQTLFSCKSRRIYRFDDRFFLILYPTRKIELSAQIILNEYGRLYRKGKPAIAVIEEHGEIIADNQSINLLMQHLSAQQALTVQPSLQDPLL